MHFVYCSEQLFRSLDILCLEALEPTLGDGDIGDEGVQLVHLRKKNTEAVDHCEIDFKKCYRTESSSSFLSLASLTLILSMDMLLPPCHKLML